jgi:hypothetical protein
LILSRYSATLAVSSMLTRQRRIKGKHKEKS